MSGMLSAFVGLSKREIIRFLRQRSRLIGALITPLLFWVLIGFGIGSSFQNPAGSGQGGYLQFFFPGMLLLSVLFTAIFSTISVIEDRHHGFLQGVLVSPQPKIVFLLAKVYGASLLATIQGALLLIPAPFMGIHLGLENLIGIFTLLFLTASTLTTLGFLLAWKMDSVAGYHSMMNILLFPMWLLSGSLFPLENRGPFFYLLSKINPLSYAVKAIRELFEVGYTSFSLEKIAVLGIFFLTFLGLSYFYLENEKVA